MLFLKDYRTDRSVITVRRLRCIARNGEKHGGEDQERNMVSTTWYLCMCTFQLLLLQI